MLQLETMFHSIHSLVWVLIMKSAMWSPSQFRIDVESNGATLVIAAFDHVRANTYFAKTFIESGSWFARIGGAVNSVEELSGKKPKHIHIFPFLHYRNSLKTLQLTTLTCRNSILVTIEGFVL